MQKCEAVENCPKCPPMRSGFFRLFYGIHSIRTNRRYGGVFEIPKFESVIKMELAPLQANLDPSFAQYFDIIPEQLVVWFSQRHHRISCQNSQKR